MADTVERLAFTVKEVQAMLGVSKDVIYDMIARGQIGSVKAGSRTLIPRIALDKYLEAAL